MSEAISTAKPAIAVTPEASTAAPGGRVGPLDRHAGVRAARAAPRRSAADSSTLNSVEIAITSAPSVTDIGFSGICSSEQHERRPAGRPARSGSAARARRARLRRRSAAARGTPAAAPPTSVPARRQRRRELGVAPRRRAPAARRPRPRRPAAGRVVDASMSSTTSCWWSSGISRMPNARFARRFARRARDHGLREVGRHRVEQRAHGLLVRRSVRSCGTGRAATAPGTARAGLVRPRGTSARRSL